VKCQQEEYKVVGLCVQKLLRSYTYSLYLISNLQCENLELFGWVDDDDDDDDDDTLNSQQQQQEHTKKASNKER